jgi:hypothetical protein
MRTGDVFRALTRAVALDILGMIPIISEITGVFDAAHDIKGLVDTLESQAKLKKWRWILFFTEFYWNRR